MLVLVDADEAFRDALAENLRDDGYTVREYGAVADVPSAATLRGACALIAEYEMPGTSGLAFADAFHAAHPAAFVILLTAFPTPQLLAQASARGFVRLLRKPINYADLRQILPLLPPRDVD